MDNNVLLPSVQQEQFSPEVEIIKEENSSDSSENYGLMSKQELLERLEIEINSKPINELRAFVESIKVAFYKRNIFDVERAKREYLDAGGEPDEFQLDPDGCEDTLKSLLTIYRDKRNEYNAGIDKYKQENLSSKLALIQELKGLIELSESSDENTYNEFVNIQKRWREIGAVPKEGLNTLWNDFHFHVESYYNIIKINKELRDLDLKKNLEVKLLLCEEAEALSLLPSFVEAFRQLQELHDKWREIGPVSKEQKSEIWDRFKQASTIINKNHQQYFEELNTQQENNLKVKEELCQRIEAILAIELQNRKEWENTTKEVLNMQKLWKTIGFAPKRDNTRVYEEFRTLCNKFFDKKQTFFVLLKEKFDNSLQVKTEICNQIQLLKDSSDWGTATKEIIELQKQWKEAGSVSSKESDAIWSEFRGACDHFFSRKQEHFKKFEEDYAIRIEAKRAIIEQLKEFSEENPHTAFEKLKTVQRNWAESGYLPSRLQNPLYEEYKAIIDTQFSTFKKGIAQKNLDSFKNRVTSGGDRGVMVREKDRLQRKLEKLQTDIGTLENNIGFFSKSSNAESFIKGIESQIALSKQEIDMIKAKIKMIIQEEKTESKYDGKR